uniref:Enhancer of mRNA-decapping protein 4 n=1 Tax=Cyprinus carpio TaxID=7962 RepID=A0A8C2JLE8_CYPCA
HSTESSLVESQRKPSFNGELNGVLGADLIGAGGLATMVEPTAHNSDKLNGQDTQTICLSGDDGSTCVPIRANNVEIVSSRDSSIDSKARGSNKVKIQPVAKYDWEHKYYYGNLIAVSNSYLAYAIRGANNHSMIRVLRLGSTERLLLKGFTGAVTDLAFAHLDSNLLGCVDEAGNMFIWQLTSHSSKIQDEVIVHIQRPEDTPLNSNRRLIWCPFIPEDNDENPEDACQTLALLHEDRAEVWDLDILRSNNSSWPVDATDLKEGFITIRGHTRISKGALSPDGTVLATASHDGFVKFWQIYIEGQDQPRCLHEWQPHNGRPLSCLLFCDNHKKQDPEVPFWCFLITGADQNQELKMWCTVSWTCLQTIRFSPDPFNSSVLPSLKASLDLSAEFLILSDVQRKVLYVMELLQDQEKGCASFTAISEFLLTHPVLSFGIQDVARARLRHTEVLPPDEESESMTTEGNQGPSESKSGIQIKLYCVHTKSVVIGSQNDLSKILALPTPADFMSPAPSALPKLMTPDAFMMPSTSIPASPGSSASSLTIVTAMSSSDSGAFSPPLVLSPSLLREAFLLCEAAPYSHRLPLQYFLSPPPQVSPPNPPLSLDLQVLDPMVVPLASPTRARSPDVISSASTAMSQDIPEIASETLQRGLAGAAADSGSVLHSDSMASAASVLHLLSPRARSSAEHSLLSLELGATSVDGEQRHNNTPSLLETALSQENAVAAGGSCSDSSVNHTWPAAPDITRETRNSLRDNGLGDWRTYHLTQNDSQDASAEQRYTSGVASLASSGNCGPRSSHRLPVKDWKTSPRSSPKLKRKSKKDEGESSQSRQIENQVSLLIPCITIRIQQREIAELRQNQLDLLQRVTSHMDAVQSSIMAHIEHAMLAQQEQEQRRMERILVEGQSRNQQLQDQLVQQLVQTLNNSLSNRLDKVLREEMKKTVPQGECKSSTNTTDAIGRAAAEAMQGPIQSAYKETFQSIVLPVFERGCQSMFQQINDSFKQGTNEYIQQLETHIKNRKQRDQDARDPVIGQLQQMIDTLQNSQDQLATTVTTSVCSDVQRQLHMIVGNLQDSILTQVQRIVKGEVSLAMKEQQAAVTSSIMQAMRSAAGTPVPSAHLDYQAQQASILQLLQQGQLNEAFQQALSAADLNLVLYVCETIDSQQVFGQQTCPLHQAVLLSLIQQLSTNLSTRTELKISYLEDAVMNLDHGDPVTRDHMSAVLSQVRQKLLHFLQQDAHSPLCKRARRLMMMLQGLVSH